MLNLSSLLGGNWFGSLLQSLLIFFGLKKIEQKGKLEEKAKTFQRELKEAEQTLEKIREDRRDVQEIHNKLITDPTYSERVRNKFTRD